MKYMFLHTHAQSPKCIVFFGGFGSRAEHFRHLEAQCSVILVYDYKDFMLHHTFLQDMKRFSEVILIAFSMGVSIAPLFVSHLPFVKKIAINGTNVGIDRVFGIHPSIFKKTITHFENKLFCKALLGEKDNTLILAPKEELQAELQSIFDFLLSQNQAKNIESAKDEQVSKNSLDSQKIQERQIHFHYDTALLSQSDAIFPFNAAKSFFASLSPLTHITITHSPHFVFFDFSSWEELCSI
ncbi:MULTISPECIES: pimeloyl-ACP methyl esterase BioG family protein [Helicobacter]|uniref:Biotin synthesis protein BioG n=4 Tax=Helicobacter typhlonius TaxID=76936 RepID=A0A0S4PTS5_9HELI|nr:MULTISPECIES: pimeloyl-ACP methyl esterase BioG family protein [Helicobacter]TLD78137.1 DUF452 family protein [Helicobacter typhlonius]TLD86438.1 DUF452 family protein [Helicobacter sp. MIT 03-1616]CUU39063.1 Biotin synthesis protein BioG [Helicobacter typhlonius]HCD72874.1 DUF452 domain-containing protein [Helicobacter sp.]